MSDIKQKLQELLKQENKNIILPVQNRIHIYPSGNNKTTYTKRQHDDIAYFCVSLFIKASKTLVDALAKKIEEDETIKTKGIKIDRFGYILPHKYAKQKEKEYTKTINDFLIEKKGK